MAGNWKMHMNHLEAIALVQKLAFTLTPKDFEAVEVAVLPPFTALRSVQTLIDGDKLRISYGAQDLSQYDSGAYTGDVSGPMLAKLGCQYVLAGHSERRSTTGRPTTWSTPRRWPRCGPGSRRSCAWGSRWRSARQAAVSATA
jgi:Triosephosphate isomerase